MSRPVVSDAAERIYAQLAAYQGGDEDGGWILLHMCEGAARTLAKCNDALRSDDLGSGGRRMFDPDRAPAWALAWLGQFVGVAASPWPTAEADQRTLIREVPNLRRGTPAAMIASAQRFLTGTKTVILVEREGGAYDLSVYTRAAETPDSAVVLAALIEQKPAGIVLTYAAATDPPGDRESWLEVRVDDGGRSWQTVEDDFATWGDVRLPF